jgi:CheY-like chemotaxis protein
VISQRLVKMLGGEPIKVESNAGAGSCFAFRLALPVVTGSSVTETRAPPQRPASTAGRLAGLRLLVVEDNEPDRFLLRLLLESEGAVVAQAEDGVEGVSAALSANPPFDTVLMDMQMPNQDGLDATRELRALGYQNPIVALTANAFARDREACLAAGMNDHVTKPVRIDDLVDVLQRHRRG